MRRHLVCVILASYVIAEIIILMNGQIDGETKTALFSIFTVWYGVLILLAIDVTRIKR